MENTDNKPSIIITSEFENSDLRDSRRNKRLRRIAELCSNSPEKSLPQTLGSVADKEGTYRFLNNDNVDFNTIIGGHMKATTERVKRCGDAVLIVHDTTDFSFTTQRKGLGRLRGETSNFGFYSHVSMAVGLSCLREPLGVVAVQNWTRTEQVKSMRKINGIKEMARWAKGVELSEERLGESVEAIHVMDREGDSYELFHTLLENERRFIIRACHDRMTEGGKLFNHAERSPLYAEREVVLSSRKTPRTPKARQIYPARRQRNAKLAIYATPVKLKRSGNLDGRRDIAKGLHLNLVYVKEQECPEGIEPVEWYLLTIETIESAEDVLAIVDAYRARWLIEEFFKSTKTGCQYEKLQLESYDALLRALAIYLVVAWMLLRLRYLAGVKEDLPAQTVLSPIQIQVLRFLSEQALSEAPTVRDVLWVLANKGGHFKHNGEPGWLVISRGLHDLLLMEQGFRAALELQKSDKS